MTGVHPVSRDNVIRALRTYSNIVSREYAFVHTGTHNTTRPKPVTHS